MKELGCSIGSNDQEFGSARVTYLEDGRVGGVQVDTSQLSKECAPAIGILGFLTVASPEHVVRADEPQWLLLPKDQDVLSCWDLRTASPVKPAARVGEQPTVKPPSRIRNVNPAYPVAAVRARIQGIIIIESTIGPTGCVTGGKVIRSIPTLDLPALRAVSSWRYTPTLLNGEPVAVTMTVTVNFTLR